MKPIEAIDPNADLEARLGALQERMRELGPAAAGLERARVALETARTLAALERGAEAWPPGREAFLSYLAAGQWQPAVEALEVLYQAEQPDSLKALGQGVWLAVSFPVDPELTVRMLEHIIDDTPDDSDGAAIAAAVAAYVIDLRPCDRHAHLEFHTGQRLADVARRHSGVQSEEQFEHWVRRLELDDPKKLLPRLRVVLDALVSGDWWFDPDRLRGQMALD